MNNISYIVNADDLGLNSNVNAAILRAFQAGWVSSTSIMANMPGFDEACQIIDEHNLKNHIGLHFVLTEGTALSEEIKHQRRFCDEQGKFRNTRKQRLYCLTDDEKKAVAKELRLQITKCRKNGLNLTHIDSHHHIHEEWGIMSVICPLMREFEIPNIRRMCNMAESYNLGRRIYTIFYNHYLGYRGLSKTHYFGSIEQYIIFKKKLLSQSGNSGLFEIMTHPIINTDNVIIDALSKKPMEQLIEQADLRHKAISFCGAKYRMPTLSNRSSQ